MNRSKLALFSGMFVAAAGAAVLVLNAAPATAPDSEEVSKLLNDIRTQAILLSSDAATMEVYTRNKVDWQGHSGAVEQMKQHINEAGRQLAKLETAKDSASPWQRTAIDRIQPLLKELAGNTNKVMAFLNEKPRRLFQPEYKDYIEANADVSSRLASMIGDFVDYGNTKHRLETLAEKLELPVSR